MNWWRERWEDFWEIPGVLQFIFWALAWGLGVWMGYLIWG